MTYTGKKITSLILAGWIVFSSAGCGRTITGYQNLSGEQFEKISSSQSGNTELSALDYTAFKEKLKEQIGTSQVILDKEADRFISSIYIDGIGIKIMLTDGSVVEGDVEHLKLGGLNLENLHVVDTQFQKDVYSQKFGDYLETANEYDKHPKISIEVSSENPILVHNEFKFAGTIGNDIEVFDWENGVDISKCQKLWFDSVFLRRDSLERINYAKTLKKLFLTNVYSGDDTRELMLDLPELEVLIFEPRQETKVHSIDLTNCVNLRKILLGNDTQIENLDFLSDLEKLQIVAFGGLIDYMSLDFLKSFEEEEQILTEVFSTDDSRLANTGNNNFISNIGGIKGKNIEVLNISFLYNVSSEQLYETVITLPNLKSIVGFEVNNAQMCSQELIKYCEENGITHPFTEKSMAIKNELRRIVSEVITPDMDTFKKIEELSKIVMERLSYDWEPTRYKEIPPEMYKRAWGENLYYTTLEGIGLCDGYTTFANALFLEAGIEGYSQEMPGHVYNLVKVNGIYYEIDLTSLDSYVESYSNELKNPIYEYEYEINTVAYMIPVGDYMSTSNTWLEPYDAERQRKGYDTSTQSEYDVYLSNDSLKSDYINNNTVASNNAKLMGIFSAIGIAKRVSNLRLQQILGAVERTTNSLSPYWSLEDYNVFYNSIIKNREGNEMIDDGEYR